MDNQIKIAVDAMGGEFSEKVIKGLEIHHKESKIFYNIFGVKI